MDEQDSQGLLKSWLGYFARKPPDRPVKPASLRSRQREAWLRADAYLQHDSDDFGDDPGSIATTLRAFEDYIQPDSNGELDPQSLQHDVPYPKLQRMRRMIEPSNRDPNNDLGTTIRVSKRRLESDTVIQQLSNLDREAKKRKVLPREEPSAGDSLEDPDADFAVLMRRHLLSLDNALRKNWICVCQNCSGLSVRLSLPPQNKADTSFEMFFGVRSVLATTLQEARITVKDAHDNRMRKDGIFQRLRPQPKSFGGDQMSRTVSLSALFQRQQELRGGPSVLPLKGKRILAVTLASALLPFLETPWLQPDFNHSRIQFFAPMQDGELPDIVKPFLAMEHIPMISASKSHAGASPDSSKHMIHPNTSVLALGILLCELHYCTPIELMQKDSNGPRNVNTDYYTSLDMLKTLEVDAGVDYYLATKACLQWEYYPPGQHADFESLSVQRRFYQNVVKRLEAEIFKSWGLRMESLGSLDSRENGLCWGSIGRDLVRQLTGKAESSESNDVARRVPHRSMSDSAPVGYTTLNSDEKLQMPAQPSQGSQLHGKLGDPTAKSLYFFDASYQTGSDQE
ncbi:Cleft lip and palate transmembrane protein 1 [Purpureocillium lavendulum]|uniref:Cleft lip and palate transmembrane protein 1 n=1 Tax=Purpureocillium lavendulum TaxID=1247861 RepID=A0AB34FG08_9HYPO|nr:Cleft lip and palate transmembrane protein 1 [Purpureocillium lavendulum]